LHVILSQLWNRENKIANWRHMAHNERQMAHTEHVSNPSRDIEAVREGLPTERVDKMAQSLAVERTVLLGILGISARTVQRKNRSAVRLSPAASDRLARMDRILVLATEAFGTKEKAAEWLKRSSRALGNQQPIGLLDTDAGTQCVERELRQIQHGFVY
jgi:putative toxin-antitoxin system antitoxin component (TIGR02293 family)